MASLAVGLACGGSGGGPSDGASDTTTASDTTSGDADTTTSTPVADSSTPPRDTHHPTADTTADPTAVLFDPDRVLEVDITLDPADLAVLRGQARNFFDLLGPDCMSGPAVSPYTWFPATVTVDGVTLRNVGVRKKGFFGSVDPVRPSLKVKFNEYVDDQQLHGMKRMTLNNGRQDPSRFNQCLSYDLFRKAGVPAPRCNYASVTLNGEDHGLYVHVESIKKPFIRRWFADDDGDLLEGALSDFAEPWVNTFDKKTNEDTSTPALGAAIAAVAADDETLLERVRATFDLDGFIRLWATEVLVTHVDGYAGNQNNFYIYVDPDDHLIHFIPWGADATFNPRRPATPGNPAGPASVLAKGFLAHRLYAHPDGRALYHAEMRRLLDEVWDEDALLAEVDRMDLLTAKARLPHLIEDAVESLRRLRAVIRTRRAEITPELATPPDWPDPMMEPPCLVTLGTIAGEVVTTWGTLGVDNIFATGSGTLDIEAAEISDDFTHIGAKSGPHDELANVGVIQVAGRYAGDHYLLFGFDIAQAAFVPDTTLPIDHDTVSTYIVWLEAGGEPQLVGFLGGGTLSFESAGTSSGADIEMSFAAHVFSLP